MANGHAMLPPMLNRPKARKVWPRVSTERILGRRDKPRPT
jgi:hypothetical protein